MAFKEDKAIYEQISFIIEQDIMRGDLKEGEQAPSTTQISSYYQINPATALKGINLLVDEGILFKKRGIGMFVAEGARNKVLIKRREKFYKDFLPKFLNEIKTLEVDVDDIIERIRKEEV